MANSFPNMQSIKPTSIVDLVAALPTPINPGSAPKGFAQLLTGLKGSVATELPTSNVLLSKAMAMPVPLSPVDIGPPPPLVLQPPETLVADKSGEATKFGPIALSKTPDLHSKLDLQALLSSQPKAATHLPFVEVGSVSSTFGLNGRIPLIVDSTATPLPLAPFGPGAKGPDSVTKYDSLRIKVTAQEVTVLTATAITEDSTIPIVLAKAGVPQAFQQPIFGTLGRSNSSVIQTLKPASKTFATDSKSQVTIAVDACTSETTTGATTTVPSNVGPASDIEILPPSALPNQHQAGSTAPIVGSQITKQASLSSHGGQNSETQGESPQNSSRESALLTGPKSLLQVAENSPLNVNQVKLEVEPPIGSTALSRSQTISVIRQISDRMELLNAARPKDGMTIHLEPQGLGEVAIQVAGVGKVIETLITASNQHVRAALADNQSGLTKAIENRGFTVSSMTVSAHPSQSAFGQSHQRNAPQPHSNLAGQFDSPSHSGAKENRPSTYRNNFVNAGSSSSTDSYSAVNGLGISGVDYWI